MSASLLRSASLFACFALAACGGGGGNDEGPIELTIESTANLDGGTTFNNNGSTNLGSASSAPLVGDGVFVASGGTLNYNAFWSFDISAIPSGATIDSAILRLFQAGTANAPTAAFALARLDHVNYGTIFPATSGAFSLLTADIAQLTDLDTFNVPKPLDVTSAVQSDVDASRPRSQFRMRPAIASNNDAAADFMVMTDGETANAANRPMLIITYSE